MERGAILMVGLSLDPEEKNSLAVTGGENGKCDLRLRSLCSDRCPSR